MLSWRGKSDLHQLSQFGPRLFTAYLPRPGNAGRLYQPTNLLLQDCQLLATVTRNAQQHRRIPDTAAQHGNEAAHEA